MHGKDYEVEVNVVDVDDQTEKAMNIALNNAEIQGVFDSDALDKLLQDIIEFPEYIDLNYDLISTTNQHETNIGIISKDPLLYPNWIVIRYDNCQLGGNKIKSIKKEIEKTGAKMICSEKINDGKE